MHLGIGYRHNCHGLQFVLACVQWEVDINFFGCRCTNMTLSRKYTSLARIKQKYDRANTKSGADGTLFSGKVKIHCSGLKLQEA